MLTLGKVPHTYEEWFDTYGDPRLPNGDGWNRHWEANALDWFRSPLPLVLSWDEGREIRWLYMHRLIGPAVVDALNELVDLKGIDYIQRNKHDRWGGCFNYRAQRGHASVISSHAFAAAVDINPHLGPLGGPDEQPTYIVEAFSKRGFKWGGEFSTIDPMHFQAGEGL